VKKKLYYCLEREKRRAFRFVSFRFVMRASDVNDDPTESRSVWFAFDTTYATTYDASALAASLGAGAGSVPTRSTFPTSHGGALAGFGSPYLNFCG
jgi:hypothetical protein